MNWNRIEDMPRQKGRHILFVQWSGNCSVSEYLASNYKDALMFRGYEMRNSFTHWVYADPPKNKDNEKS